MSSRREGRDWFSLYYRPKSVKLLGVLLISLFIQLQGVFVLTVQSVAVEEGNARFNLQSYNIYIYIYLCIYIHPSISQRSSFYLWLERYLPDLTIASLYYW